MSPDSERGGWLLSRMTERLGRRPSRSRHCRFGSITARSGSRDIVAAWATKGKPGRSTTGFRFGPIACSRAASDAARRVLGFRALQFTPGGRVQTRIAGSSGLTCRRAETRSAQKANSWSHRRSTPASAAYAGMSDRLLPLCPIKAQQQRQNAPALGRDLPLLRSGKAPNDCVSDLEGEVRSNRSSWELGSSVSRASRTGIAMLSASRTAPSKMCLVSIDLLPNVNAPRAAISSTSLARTAKGNSGSCLPNRTNGSGYRASSGTGVSATATTVARRANVLHREAQRAEQLGGKTAPLAYKPQENVLGSDVTASEMLGLPLRHCDDPGGFVSRVVQWKKNSP